jgi:hypothetical protein
VVVFAAVVFAALVFAVATGLAALAVFLAGASFALVVGFLLLALVDVVAMMLSFFSYGINVTG